MVLLSTPYETTWHCNPSICYPRSMRPRGSEIRSYISMKMDPNGRIPPRGMITSGSMNHFFSGIGLKIKTSRPSMKHFVVSSWRHRNTACQKYGQACFPGAHLCNRIMAVDNDLYMNEWMNEWNVYSLKLYNFYKWEQ